MGGRHSDHYQDDDYDEGPNCNYGKSKVIIPKYLLGIATLEIPGLTAENDDTTGRLILRYENGQVLEVLPGDSRMASGQIKNNTKVEVVDAVIIQSCFVASKIAFFGKAYFRYVSLFRLKMKYIDSEELLERSWGGGTSSSSDLEIPGSSNN